MSNRFLSTHWSSLLLLLGLYFAALATGHSQSSLTTTTSTASYTNREPGRSSIESFYANADAVALVEVTSSDNENYTDPVYKAKVITAYKALKKDQIIFFGPFIGTGLGNQYVVFLKADAQPLSPNTDAKSGFGPVSYYRVMREGYGEMALSYECGFPGNEIKDRCDYAVRICTDYVTLPKSMLVSPSAKQETPFGCRFVRQKEFFSLMKRIVLPTPVPR